MRGSPEAILGAILEPFWEQDSQLYSLWGALGSLLALILPFHFPGPFSSVILEGYASGPAAEGRPGLGVGVLPLGQPWWGGSGDSFIRHAPVLRATHSAAGPLTLGMETDDCIICH